MQVIFPSEITLPLISLGKVVKPVERSEVPIPGKIYRQIGVKLWGEGAYERESIDGSQTQYKTLSRVEAGDIIVNKIWARNGSVAVVSQNLAGCYGSNEFPTFAPIQDKLEPHWFHWITKTKFFWEQCDEKSRGTSGKNRIRPEKFLEVNIPLPPLDEQRRIVARIEELAAKVEEARGLRSKALNQVGNFVANLHLHLAESRIIQLDKILVLDEEREAVESGKQYPQVGVRGFGGGLFIRETLDATQTTYKAFNRLYEGAIVLSQVKGWEGAIAGCPRSLAGKFVSPEYRTFRCIPEQAIPEYMAALVATPWFWTQLQHLTRGLGDRRERTRPEQFLRMEIPMPTIDQQKKALEAFSKLDAVKRLQSQTAAELDALLPSILDKAFKGEL